MMPQTGLDKVLGDVLFGEAETVPLERQFLDIMNAHPFLRKNDFLSSMERTAERYKFKGKPYEIVKKFVKQWSNKRVQRYLRLLKKYDFLKMSDAAGVYQCLISGIELNEKQHNWLKVFLAHCRENKDVLAFLRKNPEPKINTSVFQLLIENKIIPSNEIGFVLSKIKDKHITMRVREREYILAKYSRIHNKNNTFEAQLAFRIKKRLVISSKQFAIIKSRVGKVTEQQLNKDYEVIRPERKRVISV